MEIGSFIDLELPRGHEYYTEERFGNGNIARLNTGRAAIWHAFRLTGCERIWIPYYQCETVREFLCQKNAEIRYYHIDEAFTPIGLEAGKNDAVLLVNYYGIMSQARMRKLAKPFDHAIIDNSQAFFANPFVDAYQVYSARKFVGVPDGAYVIGKNADAFTDGYARGYSSDTALFLLQRTEYGCEGKAYASRCENEIRIDTEDIRRMSPLTQKILDGTDYDRNRSRRRENFETAETLFRSKNRLDARIHYADDCVPMIYPLLIEDCRLLGRLLEAKHFQGHWWKWVAENPESNDFEKWISMYMVPITIDQRYGRKELEYIAGVL